MKKFINYASGAIYEKKSIVAEVAFKIMEPSLNRQMNSNALTLFTNGIMDTQSQMYCK